jgi:hypothetical protein
MLRTGCRLIEQHVTTLDRGIERRARLTRDTITPLVPSGNPNRAAALGRFPHRHAQQGPRWLTAPAADRPRPAIPLRPLGELDRDVHRAAVPEHLQRGGAWCRPQSTG